MKQDKSSTGSLRGLTIGRFLMLVCLLAIAATAAAAPTVKFATPPWPGAAVKTQVAREILDAIGYQTSSGNAAYAMLGVRGYDENSATGSWAVNVSSVGNGFKDADLATWMPMERGLVDPLVKSGKIKLLVANLPQAQYGLVVPDYVWRAGVRCICDLQKHGNKFDHTIYGIERGNEGNAIVKKMIRYNTYNLQQWTLVEGSVTSMLDKAQRLIRQHKWVVFLGWKPHWMNTKLDLHYLKDPQNLWHMKQTLVYTAVNTDFMNKNPNVARFLKQMVVGSEIQSQWIYDYSYKGISVGRVASDWLSDHMDTVGKWLDGVKTADGKRPAIAALKAKFSS